MEEFELVVEERDEEWGFNIQFDRPYNILSEKLPVDSNTAARIMDEAYMGGYSDEEMGEVLGDKATVGTVRIADEDDEVGDVEFEIEWDGDAVEEVYG